MKRVFLSFIAEDRKQVDGLRLLAANPRFGVEFYDESVRTPYDSFDAAYIRGKIREKIQRSSVTVCLLSQNTHLSKWVTWELEESIKQGNTIVCMGLPDGPERLTIPKPAKDLEIGWWGWDLEKLKNLIDNA